MRQLAAVLCLVCLSLTSPAAAAEVDHDQLASIRDRAEATDHDLRGPRYDALLRAPSAPMAALLADERLSLVGVLPSGRPLFLILDNLVAAATVNTAPVWPGGATGLGLDGANEPGELAIWDGGKVRLTHREFGGRVIAMDGYPTESSHATHVAGTMVAAGMVAGAHGMSPAATLFSYEAGGDVAEMAYAATRGLLVSNHSYGIIAGWFYGYGGNPDWYWFGDTAVSEREDPSFGFYGTTSAAWDDIAHAAPHYLICKSAGNDRSDQGPPVGASHYVWSGAAGDWVVSTAGRDPDGGYDGFDSVSRNGVAKNVLTVGAVHDIPRGWTEPSDVVAAGFSAWGPADDGRIKPDLVANGIDLYSSIATSDFAYDSYSGTSTSTPNASGSLNLLVQQYKSLHGGQPPLASTLKAVVLHTAHEAGPAPGPDYMFGWGLLNTAGAALLIADHGAGGERIVEAVLDEGVTDVYRFAYDGSGPLKATLVWTDLPGTPPVWSLDPSDPMLVNDLDLRLVRESDGAVLLPWALDPATPAAAATTGINRRDNVEVIEPGGAAAGSYRLEVAHAGQLTGRQEYSLVVTGLVADGVTGLNDQAPVPASRLLRAEPNPFNPRTTVVLALDREQEARLEVFDLRGRRVAVLHDGSLPAGEHRVAWDGLGDDGRRLSSGTYLLRLRAGSTVDCASVTLVE